MSTSWRAAGSAFLSGALFAVGLAVAGMTNPAKVVGFLDLFGAWDPSLAFVMIGAIGVHVVAVRWSKRRRMPLFDGRFHLPTRRDVDVRLVVGSALFGVGWALAGFCPGPGLVAMTAGQLPALVFVLGMAAGAKLEHWTSRRIARVRERMAASEM